MRDIVVIGAGGFGRETIDTIRAINAVSPTWTLLGVVDDALSPANADRLEFLGVTYLGSVADLPAGVSVAVAVGAPAARVAIVARLGRHAELPSLIHPSTIIGSAFCHGAGLITLAGVSIGTNVSLGDHVHLNAHSVIGHDTHLADYVSVNPNATISGDCHIGPKTLVGASATLLQGLAIGRSVTVGAAACVVRDVADDQLVKGVPAR
ncbi:sugar acetyltransferase [Janibacter anophelis]|uniref:PglD-related sugar-binding protein n=1 Tax=Janibacter anophelis TaxID=319054 RepID=UPI000DF00032|nr:sugar acetyltransferase [Janibacter anophelis]